MPTIQETLERMGFTLNETKTYLSLLNLGSCLASDLAKKTGLHRRPVYDALSRLIEKGLASHVIKAGKKYFQASNPEKIIDILKERENEIKDLMPDLQEKFQKIKPEFLAEVYEGREGLKTVMELILNDKGGWLTIGSTGKGQETLQYYLEQFSKRREKLGIKRKILTASTQKGIEYSKILKKQKFIDVRFLSKEIQNPQTIWIFGNKVAIILVSIEQPIIFLIDSKDISNSFKEYFNLLWRQAKP